MSGRRVWLTSAEGSGSSGVICLDNLGVETMRDVVEGRRCDGYMERSTWNVGERRKGEL